MTKRYGLIRYPGSKAKLWRPIVERMPEGIIFGVMRRDGLEYREPFFGAGAIGFRVLDGLHSSSRVWLNDKDYWLTCLWNTVKDSPEELTEMVMSFNPSPQKFFEFKEADGDVAIDPVVAGFQKLAVHQMSVSGFGVMSGSCLGGRDQTNAKYPVDCRWNAIQLAENIKNRHKQFARFGSRLKVTCRDFSELLNRNPKCFVYLDPPYVEKGPVLYKHGMTPDDHIRLAKCVLSLGCPWLLSYDDHPLVRELYQECSVDEIHVTYTNATHVTGERPRNREILISPPTVNN